MRIVLSIIYAFIATIVAAVVASMLLGFVIPETTDPYPPSNGHPWIGFVVWGVAIALGLLVFRRQIQSDVEIRCEGCAYRLRENLTGTCPECGTDLSKENVAKLSRV